MVVTAIPVVQSKGCVTTVSEIVSVAIGQGELPATRVVVGVGDKSPLTSVFAIDPGNVVGSAFEVARGEGGCACADGCHGMLGENKSGDSEDGGELHDCRIVPIER